MPNVAIQDYIVVEVANLSSPTTAEKAILKAKIAEGTIRDTLILNEVGEVKDYLRVLAYEGGDTGYVAVYDLQNSQIVEIELA